MVPKQIRYFPSTLFPRAQAGIHIPRTAIHSICSAWTRARGCCASCRRAWLMWLRFADARVERAWRAYHAASHTSTDLLWCALLLLVWLVAIGKRFFTHGPTPLLLAGGPALLLLAVRQPRLLCPAMRRMPAASAFMAWA